MDFDRMLRYCAALELHNDRAWFHAPENYALYTAAKQEFIDLVDELKYRIANVASPELAEKLIFADAKALLYRIPRDMRSNKGKPPYNPRWGADLSGDRHSILPVGYYVHIQPGDRSFFGTGAWCPDGEMLLNVRTYISENFDRFSDALERSGCPMFGDRLKNVPRGFDPADPAAEYLKFKDWLVSRAFPDTELRGFEGFAAEIAACAERMEPLRRFFNDALSQKKRCPWDVGDWE